MRPTHRKMFFPNWLAEPLHALFLGVTLIYIYIDIRDIFIHLTLLFALPLPLAKPMQL